MSVRCVFVTLGPHTVAVPVADLRGVEAITQVIPLPHVEPWVLGATHHQGAVYSVIDLALIMGVTDESISPQNARMLVHRDADIRVALGVTPSTIMKTFEETALEDVAPLQQDLVRHCSRTIVDGDQRIPVLDSGSILELLLSADAA